jgi:hypothetical protein
MILNKVVNAIFTMSDNAIFTMSNLEGCFILHCE